MLSFLKRHKKLLLSICLAAVLFISGLLAFVIVPNIMGQFKPVSGGPENRTSVSGNGGNAVMVGDYLYYIGGYVSSSSIVYKQNEYNNVRGEGAIYRIKMTGTPGQPKYDNSYLEDLDIDDWDWGSLDSDEQREKYGYAMDKVLHSDSDLQLVVPKIAGWERSALWVFDNNLIYTSPNNQKNKFGVLQTNKVDFFRADLSGANHKKLYTTQTDEVTNGNFTAVSVDGNVYLLCRDGQRLVRVDMNGGVHEISGKADSAAMPTVSTYIGGTNNSENQTLAKSYAGIMGYVFFTETREDDDVKRGNIMKRYNILTGQTDVLRHDHNTHTMLALGNGILMFETAQESPSVIKNLYAVDNVNSDFGSEAYMNANYNTGSPLLTGAKLYLAGEKSSARYLAFLNSSLYVYEKSGKTYKVAETLTDVSEVTEVTASGVLYKTTAETGEMKHHYFGGFKPAETYAAVTGTVTGSRTTAFQILNKSGQPNGGYMFFYVKTVEEYVESAAEEGETPNLASVTVGAVFNAEREFILSKLEEKFIQMPKEI